MSPSPVSLVLPSFRYVLLFCFLAPLAAHFTASCTRRGSVPLRWFANRRHLQIRSHIKITNHIKITDKFWSFLSTHGLFLIFTRPMYHTRFIQIYTNYMKTYIISFRVAKRRRGNFSLGLLCSLSRSLSLFFFIFVAFPYIFRGIPLFTQSVTVQLLLFARIIFAESQTMSDESSINTSRCD